MGLDYFRYYTRWNDHANRRRYDAPADPWGFVHVDPTEVTRFNVVSLKWGLGRVRGGDWDRPENCRRLDDIAIYEGARQRFEEGLPWAETVYADWARDRFADGDQVKGCEDLDGFLDGYCGALDDLYEDIRANGYRPNRGHVYEGPADAEYIHDLEPMALVGRDGEVVWTEGFHRLVLAALLDVDAIPVYVLQRHAGWQATRERVATGGRPDGVDVDHPDLADLVS